MLQNHKISVFNEENKIQIDGALSGKNDSSITVSFKNIEDVELINKIAMEKRGERFILNMYHPVEGIIPHTCEVLYAGDNKITFRIVKELKPVQRRNYVKVKTNIYTTISTIYYRKNKKKFSKIPTKGVYYKKAKGCKIKSLIRYDREFAIDLINPFEIRIDDFSGGGILFTSSKKMRVGTIFTYNFKNGNREISIKTEVLRRMIKNNGNYAYGCRFLEIKRREEECLCEYVFQLQAENLRMKR